MGRPVPHRFIIPPALPPSYEPAPTPPWHPPPPPPSSDLGGWFIVFLFVVFAVYLLIFLVFGGRVENREDRGRPAEAAAAAPPPRALPQLQPSRHFEELRRLRQAWAANPAARRLPAFQYNLSVKHNVAGGGEEEAAACPVCLGAFQHGEMVRLLPLCLHLYHVECIDAWLDAHSTCPICRSNTVPAMDIARVPPV